MIKTTKSKTKRLVLGALVLTIASLGVADAKHPVASSGILGNDIHGSYVAEIGTEKQTYSEAALKTDTEKNSGKNDATTEATDTNNAAQDTQPTNITRDLQQEQARQQQEDTQQRTSLLKRIWSSGSTQQQRDTARQLTPQTPAESAQQQSLPR